MLQKKFSQAWVSVRQAFLDLDSDKDGYINQYDMMRYFGDENIDGLDLQKLFHEKGRVIES